MSRGNLALRLPDGAPFAASERASVGMNPSSSPSPGERSTKGAPPWRGIVTSRSNGTSRSSQLTRRPLAPSISPVANSVSTRMSLAARRPASSADAMGLVNAPSSGVTNVMSTASRTPRSRRNQSARKQNSSGATGHLIGISTGLTTRWPRSKSRSASRSAVADSSS